LGEVGALKTHLREKYFLIVGDARAGGIEFNAGVVELTAEKTAP
jgi:hypothetical protein